MQGSSSFRYYIDFILVLTHKEIKVRYKNSFLGYLWSIAHPLAFALTFFFVFKVVMRFPMHNYSLFLISALFPWQAFANSVTTCSSIFIFNASLIKKVYFPRYLLVLTALLNDSFHFIMSLPVLILLLFLYNMIEWKIVYWIFYIPLNLLAQMLITFGICLCVGSINVFFRDIERLVAILLNLVFYFTPILYPIEMVPKNCHIWFQANPLCILVANWRNIYMKYDFDWQAWLLTMLVGLLITGAGSWIYAKLNPKFSEAI